MAIDYVLGVQCEAKQNLGVERLVTLHRTRIIARAALTQARAGGDHRAAEDISLAVATNMVSGAPAASTTIAGLMARSAALDAYGDECRTCPAAPHGAEFGCHQRINYPIAEDAEAWLMSRLPKSLDSAAGALLVRGMQEFTWDGAPVAKLRTRAGEFLESRVPYGVRWQLDGKPVEVSSDQLLQMMFFVGHLAPTHCLMLALFVGAVSHDASFHDLKDSAGRAKLMHAAVIERQADPAVEQVAAFLRAVLAAARLEVPLFIDG
ncbi:MAG: hypothetical protein KBG15_13000 [Kofleriaceae bacterium]|nr:hypothetical protein [Kofleriaceae bacterium]